MRFPLLFFLGPRAFGEVKGLLYSKSRSFWLMWNLVLRARKLYPPQLSNPLGGLGNSWSPVSKFSGAGTQLLYMPGPWPPHVALDDTQAELSHTESKLSWCKEIPCICFYRQLFCTFVFILCTGISSMPAMCSHSMVLFRRRSEPLIPSVPTASDQVHISITSAWMTAANSALDLFPFNFSPLILT